MKAQTDGSKVARRAFIRRLGSLLSGAAVLAVWGRLPATTTGRQLSFHHTHTGESLSLRIVPGGDWAADGLDRFDHFLRDFRTGDVHEIDRGLLGLLLDLHRATGSQGEFEVISGYRSPETNSMLRGKSRSVAKRSLHMEGRAIDVRLTDVATEDLRDAAIRLKRGGVGYYRKSDFVHLDTGRFRSW